MTNKTQGRGSISLGKIAERLNVLVVSCDRCGRARPSKNMQRAKKRTALFIAGNPIGGSVA